MTSSPDNKLPEGSSAAAEPTLPAISSVSSSNAGVKRPAPSLLPPFEPLSSSPGFPRPLKRQARAGSIGTNAYAKYPTPVPTSSTGILSSSPSRVGLARPGLARTQSALAERAPLSAVPSVELSENGEELLMGRSSNSSNYQLSANRLVSRVHVKARYIPAPNPSEPSKIEIVCNGWNGLTLHCQGKTWELAKGDTFTSETENADIMIDVQDARVMVQWPKKDRHDANLSDSSWEDSPKSRPRRNASASDLLQSSPFRRHARIKSPESPTPANKSAIAKIDSALDGKDASEPVQIYEDPVEDQEETQADPDVGVSFAQTVLADSFSSDLSDPEDDEEDPDEENDPIVHSFGPFGANLTKRLAAVTSESPSRPSHLSSGDSTVLPSVEPEERGESGDLEEEEERPLPSNIDVGAVTNHVVNQLAFSRLSSSPLTTVFNNLPHAEMEDLTKRDLRRILESTDCIGIIPRQGKDAAGQLLESEYYYIPERDSDDSRRIAVNGLGRQSLRSCRKQHKQYYWKRPKTPTR